MAEPVRRPRVVPEDEALSVAKAALLKAEQTSDKVDDVSLKLDRLLAIFGHEEEDGSGGYKGTGILGRLRRAEANIKALLTKYQTALAMVAGFTAAVTLIVGLFTFLLSQGIVTIK